MTHTTARNAVLTLATCGRIDRIPVSHLVRIEALSNYSKLVLASGRTIVASKVLKEFERALNNQLFVRAHKTHLVNILFVRSYQGGEHSSLLLSNGERISVARRKRHCVHTILSARGEQQK